MTIAEITSTKTRTWFRAVAIAEAVSWLALLIAMGFKYLPADGNDSAVRIPGMIHGAIFMAYVLCCFLARSRFGWTTKTTLLALASSIPPFCTVIFEILADKRGLLAAKKPVTS